VSHRAAGEGVSGQSHGFHVSPSPYSKFRPGTAGLLPLSLAQAGPQGKPIQLRRKHPRVVTEFLKEILESEVLKVYTQWKLHYMCCVET